MDSKRLSQLAGLTESIRTESVTVNFPQIITGFNETSEIELLAKFLTELVGKNVKTVDVNEIAFDFGAKSNYTSVFYLSRKPTKAEIAEMVEVKFKVK